MKGVCKTYCVFAELPYRAKKILAMLFHWLKHSGQCCFHLIVSCLGDPNTNKICHLKYWENEMKIHFVYTVYHTSIVQLCFRCSAQILWYGSPFAGYVCVTSGLNINPFGILYIKNTIFSKPFILNCLFVWNRCERSAVSSIPSFYHFIQIESFR